LIIAMDNLFYTVITCGAVLLAFTFLSIVILVVRRYKRCPSNRILVVYGKSGKGQTSICIHGGARLI